MSINQKACKLIDLSVYLPHPKALIISDLHIGFEEAMNKQGVFIPRFQLEETMKRLESILQQVRPKTIIINGDLKDEFGVISKQEWRDTFKLLEFLEKRCKQVILVKGNHDMILGPIAEKKGMSIVDYLLLDGYIICHGHQLIEELIKKNNQSNQSQDEARVKKAHTIIIGHEHPCISLKEGNRVERYKCFLVGRYKNKNLIVLPSFNLVTEGSDIFQEQRLSPYCQKNLRSFEVYVVDPEGHSVLDFGILKDLIKH
ncbi:metallophosphoesterase [Candidatus Woesearchaeota archaeon]|nr:metallophosphoesterase [Candidatus Woesearchaeota archaeon]